MILTQPLYNLLCPGSNSSRITTWIPYYNLNWRFIKLILQMWNQVSSISRKFLQRKRREFWRIADRCYEVGKLEKRTWRHRASSGWRRPARIETFQSRPHVAHSNNISKTEPKKAKGWQLQQWQLRTSNAGQLSYNKRKAKTNQTTSATNPLKEASFRDPPPISRSLQTQMGQRNGRATAMVWQSTQNGSHLPRRGKKRGHNEKM